MHRDLKSGKLVFDKRSTNLEITPAERKEYQILIVESESIERDQIRQALFSIGYPNVVHAQDHIAGIEAVKNRNFSHVIFTAQTSNMPPDAFLSQLLEMASYTVAIPSSFDPQAEDVFTLLQKGARGFLVKPFTAETLESGLLMATKGDPMSDAVLHAKDRNEAFSALIAASFDKLATTERQAQTMASAERLRERHLMGLKSTMDIARLFAEGGEDQLLDRMVEFFIQLGNGRASRLGRLRDRLRNKRQSLKATPSEPS